MPSFDIVSRVDMQLVDNAVNNVKRDINQRYDFKGTHNEVNLDRDGKEISIVAADNMKMEALREMMMTNCVRQQVDTKAIKFGEFEPTSGGALKCEVTVQEGIEREVAQKVIKLVKDAKLKVQTAIQGDELRVTGKKIDDLQTVMALVKEQDLGVALQYINMRS
jgi:hypothetical protein